MKLAVATLAVMLAVQSVFSQTESKSTKLHLGINFGADYSTLQVANANPLTIREFTTSPQAGFRLGLVTDYALSNQFAFVFNPDLSLDKTSLTIVKIDNSNAVYQTAIAVGAAAHIVYKHLQWSTRPYILFGPRYDIPVISKTGSGNQLAKSNLSLELGIGLERAFPNFVFSPELRYSYGLSNISATTDMQSVQLHTISLILIFKGKQ